MRTTREPRQSVLSLKITRDMRRVVEELAAQLTIQKKCRHTLTDVVEEAIRLLAKRERIKI